MIVDSMILISLGNLGKIELITDCIIPEKVLKEITNEPAKSALLNLKYHVRLFKNNYLNDLLNLSLH